MINEKPMIIDLGCNDYATLYGYNINTDNLELKYRYTGEKSNIEVEMLLNELVTKAFDITFKGFSNDR